MNRKSIRELFINVKSTCHCTLIVFFQTWPTSNRVNYIQRSTTPSLKRVASVFANEQSKNMKSDKDISQDFNESTLEEYAISEVQKVS